MADVIVGDLLTVTSGPRNGLKFWVRELKDERSLRTRLTPLKFLTSECTIQRMDNPDVTNFNDWGQFVVDEDVIATGQDCQFQMKSGGIRERGWGQQSEQEDVVFFDDKSFRVEQTQEEGVG